MFQAFWPLTLLMLQPHARIPWGLTDRLPAELTHFLAVVTEKMCHSSRKHFPSWFQPDIIQRDQLDSFSRVQKVRERNWTLTAGWPLFKHKPHLNLNLLITPMMQHFQHVPKFELKLKGKKEVIHFGRFQQPLIVPVFKIWNKFRAISLFSQATLADLST